MPRRVLSRSEAACAAVFAVLLAIAPWAMAQETPPPAPLGETPIRLFDELSREVSRTSDALFLPGQALASPDIEAASAAADDDNPHAEPRLMAVDASNASPMQTVPPRYPAASSGPMMDQDVLPAAAYGDRSALSSATTPQYRLARDVKQEELPAPGGIEQAFPGGEIILTEQPGLMGAACFDCPSCGGPGCVPGRTRCCSACNAKTRWGRFWCAMYETICCPDPCWDPSYLPLADSAFFVPTARPTTTARYRWDAGYNLVYPDRAEWFWAQDNGSGLGPQPVSPYQGEPSVDYDELSMYVETAIKGFALTVETPYRSVDPFTGGVQAGFGDIIIGTKSLIFDRELFQIAFQFRTFVPSGKALEGLGVGHISLEPSLIVGFNLSPASYLQGQIAQWIPLGGGSYQGSILHYHFSYNHTLHYILPDVPLIGTLEANGWSFQDGSYTDPVLGTLPANDHTYLSAAVGLRMFVCEWLDAGAAANFAIGSPNWAEQLYRLECRVRF